jgi:SAM-dependent methyltransferase
MLRSSFTRLYAAHAVQFTEDLPFWRDLAKSSGSPVLELGCGPGRVLLDLIQQGFCVTGLDISEEMLQWTRAQIPEKLREKNVLIQGDMRRFHLAHQYPLIIVPCNTFAYFDDSEALQSLQCVKHHLTRHGQLVMAVPNPAQYASFEDDLQQAELSESEPISDFIEPISGNPVQVYAYEEFDKVRKILKVLWALDELFPDGQVKRFQHMIYYYLRSLEDIQELLRTVRMSVMQVYGDYQGGPLDPDSHEMIIIAVNADENN